MTKLPTKPGAYWAALDNGDGNVRVVLLHVRFYEASSSFDDGALCDLVDGSGWSFEVARFEQGQIVQPSRIAYAGSRGGQNHEQVKVTWYGEAKPPAAALKQKPSQN